MRILVLSVSFPSPARSGGERRLANLLAGLAPRHELGIVALRRGVPDAEFAKRFALVDLVDPPPPRRPLPFPIGAMRAWSGLVFGALPGFARGSATAGFTQAVRRALAAFRPDVVYVEPVDVAHHIAAVKRAGVPVCFGAIEVVSDKTSRWLELMRTASGRFAGSRELARTRRLEGESLRIADAIVCVSDADRAAIVRWTGRDAAVAPNGVDTSEFVPVSSMREPGVLLMVGPLAYAANLDAVEWFARDVLPQIPGARLDVAGRPATAPLDLGEHVHVLGVVDDVRPYLARAAALVAPLRIGGGTRLKILEALAMQTPVVTTTVGAEGLAVRDGEHVLIADDAASFARAVRSVIEEPALGERLGKAGRALVEREYGWQRSIDVLEEALMRIARPASRAAS